MYLEEQDKKMTESILKFPLLYHSAKEVGNSGKKTSGIIQNIFLCYLE